jgi:hypothetical protein
MGKPKAKAKTAKAAKAKPLTLDDLVAQERGCRELLESSLFNL